MDLRNLNERLWVSNAFRRENCAWSFCTKFSSPSQADIIKINTTLGALCICCFNPVKQMVMEKYKDLWQVLGIRNTINYTCDMISGVYWNKLDWATKQGEVRSNFDASWSHKWKLEAKWDKQFDCYSVCMAEILRVFIHWIYSRKLFRWWLELKCCLSKKNDNPSGRSGPLRSSACVKSQVR